MYYNTITHHAKIFPSFALFCVESVNIILQCQCMNSSRHLQNAPALGVAEQLVRSSELRDAAICHDEDAVAVHDGVEPVGDGQHRAVPEPLPGDRGSNGLVVRNIF